MADGKFKKLPPDLSRPRGVEPRTPEWAEWVLEIEAYLGYRVCGAKNSKGIPCIRPPEKRRERCGQHGGKTPRGVASPSWKTGKCSIYAGLLPAKMAEDFEAVMTDPKLLALETDIALLELRQVELLREIQSGLDPAAALRQAGKFITDLRQAVAEGNVVSIGMAAEDIAEALDGGVETARAWESFMRTGEQKRKHVESEGKRLERMQAFLTADEARTRDQMLIAIIIRAAQKLRDPKEARQLLSDVVEGTAALSGMQPTRELDPRQLPAHLQD